MVSICESLAFFKERRKKKRESRSCKKSTQNKIENKMMINNLFGNVAMCVLSFLYIFNICVDFVVATDKTLKNVEQMFAA